MESKKENKSKKIWRWRSLMEPQTYIHTRVTTTNIHENRKAEAMEKKNKKRRLLEVAVDM